MKFSLDWLKEYVKIDCAAEVLSEKLTMAGLEVEGIEYLGEKLKGIITAKIESITKHPNADKLVVTSVNDGKKSHQIVTGATNIKVGDIVPISTSGSVLCNGLKIKHTKLRGVDSEGMLCSEAELGVAEEAEGIWILPADTPLGIDFIEYGKLQDVVIDISILPNRGDCQSIYGLAREISVILKKELKEPEIKISETPGQFTFSIDIKDKKLCLLYSARIIKDVKQGVSPLWLQRRLQVMGIRPIDVIVDITNYVLLELGQPLHAFDYHKLQGHKIIVRKAKAGEKIITLDQERRVLDQEMLLICDGKNPVAIGGVMGAGNSEIGEDSKDILLESAFFIPGNIRKTETKLKLRTESAVRFEKGVDINGVISASDRASYLMQTLAQGKVVKGIFKAEDSSSDYSKPYKINFSLELINKLLGTVYTKTQALDILKALGFDYEAQKNNIKVPSWRRGDIQEKPDLAEEIARISGYHTIPSKLPANSVVIDKVDQEHELKSKLEKILIDLGLNQITTFPMIAPHDFEKLRQADKESLRLAKPLSINESVLRKDMLASILKIFAFNQNRQMENIKLFEVGKVFPRSGKEYYECAVLLSGDQLYRPYLAKDKEAVTDFFYLKGMVEKVLAGLNIRNLEYENTDNQYFHPGKSAVIKSKGKVLGELGLLHPNLLKEYDLKTDAGYFYLAIPELAKAEQKKRIYHEFPHFPQTRRDLAIIIPKSLTFGEITAVFKEFKPKYCVDYYMFDSFESEDLGKDKKSMAFAFIYQAHDKTLEVEEINTIHDKFSKFITSKLPVSFR